MVGNHQASVKKWLFRVPGIRLSIDAHSDNLTKKLVHLFANVNFFWAFGSEPEFFFLGHILWLCLQIVTKRSRKADDLWASSQPSVDYESGANAFRDPKFFWDLAFGRRDCSLWSRHSRHSVIWDQSSTVYDMLSQVEIYIYYIYIYMYV